MAIIIKRGRPMVRLMGYTPVPHATPGAICSYLTAGLPVACPLVQFKAGDNQDNFQPVYVNRRADLCLLK